MGKENFYKGGTGYSSAIKKHDQKLNIKKQAF